MSVIRRIDEPAPELMRSLAQDVAAWLAEAIAMRAQATLAIPGGTTPGPFFDALSQTSIDWSSVRIFLTDERWVSPGSARSNETLVRDRLLRGNAASARFVSLYPGSEPTSESALAPLPALDARIKALLPIDVCVLGMGEDGHTASLFPGADALATALDLHAQSAVFAMSAPGAPEPRISLGAAALCQSHHICLLLVGAAKRRVLETALGAGPVAAMPVRAVLRSACAVHVYCST